MKKIFDNFYIFLKFSSIFILLLCLVSILYVFYKNYQKEETISNNQNSIQQKLQENIKSNSDLIKSVTNEIILTQKALKEIKKEITSLSTKKDKENLTELNKNIKNLNDKFGFLSKEIKIIKEKNFTISKNLTNNQSSIIKNSKNEIIDLIILKYENNINFESELDYLKKILGEDKKILFEKIYILSIKPYEGHKNLKNTFKRETNLFLKSNFDKSQNAFFNKIILPLIDISPSTENKITNDLLIDIQIIKTSLENKEYTKAYKILKNIKNYETKFEKTSLQINKYLIFTELLKGLK